VHRTDLDARRVLTVLTLDGHVDKTRLRNQGRIIVMFLVLEVDKVAPLQADHPDPVELRVVARVVVLLDARINASPAADAAGKIKPVAPEGIGHGTLGADLELLPIFLPVPLLELRNDPFLLFLGHFDISLLEEILGFLFGAGRE